MGDFLVLVHVGSREAAQKVENRLHGAGLGPMGVTIVPYPEATLPQVIRALEALNGESKKT